VKKAGKLFVLGVALLLVGASLAEARPGGRGGGHGVARGHAPSSSHAHSRPYSHSHARPHYGARVVVGVPYYHPYRRYYYAGPAFYYAAPAYVAPAYYASPPAPVYVEQPQAQPEAPSYWYYCPSARGYYPQVQSCPEGWTRVAPAPPPG
jgi:hypothetical protein